MDRPSFDDIIASICWEPEFPNAEARYRYERASAEQQFRRYYDIWENANLQNPPHSVIAYGLPGGPQSVCRTDERDEGAIANSLRHYIAMFVYQDLAAYGRLLIANGTPGSEAVLLFEQHAEELLAEAYNRKWLYGLRRLELADAELSDRFRVLRSGCVEKARHEFEGLVWKADLEHAASPEVTACALPAVALVATEAVEHQLIVLPTPSRNKRLSATVTSPSAVRKMVTYMESKAIGETQFATSADTTDRTLRRFRKTGKVRRDIFNSIAKAMGITAETLLKTD